MACTTTSILILLSILVPLFSLPCRCRAFEIMNWSCNNGTSYAANTTYHSNVRAVLASLSASTPNSTNGFARASAGGGGPDTVWGLALCRADTDDAGCASCLALVPAVAFNACRGVRDVTVFYDRCLLRYSYVDFMARPDNTEVQMGSPSQERITINAGRFDALVAGLVDALSDWAAFNSTSRYAAGVMTSVEGFTSTTEDLVHNIYGLVQCTPDQAPPVCRACLEAFRGDMAEVFDGRMGGQFNAVWCNFRYETFPFYDGTPAVKLVAPTLWPPAARENDAEEDDGSGPLLFDLPALRKATGNFAEDNKLGHGGFGAVYKGFLPDGREIAVKRLDKASAQGLEQLKNELLLVVKLRHNNLAKLLGVCIKGQEKLLVYEYLPNRSLDTFLFDPEKRERLDWDTRYHIIYGTARGLLYLHEDSQIKILHRDLKASNVLLDANMNPKISDFGLARLFDGSKTNSITSQVVGTLGYMAPEYAVLGHLSVKLDVYSFGVLVLEIVTGRKNTDMFDSVEESNNLLSYVWDHWLKGAPLEITDASLLDGQTPESEVLKCVHLGLLCVQENPADRPTMLSVLVMLHSQASSFASPSKPAFAFAHSGDGTSPNPRAVASSVNEVSMSEFQAR